MTRATMLEQVTSAELGEWMAYERIEPLDNHRLEILLAVNALIHANANRDTKARPRPYTMRDIAPWLDPPQQTRQTDEQQAATAELVTRVLNACPRKE